MTNASPRLFAACAAALAALPAAAQDPASPMSAGSLLQVFAGLLLVLALVIAAAWALRRIGHDPFKQAANGARHPKEAALAD